jgi:MoaA/NifB/PqqE/SkfB family radical SAM enzyme
LAELQAMDSLPIAQEGVLYHCPLTPAKRRNLALQEVNKRFLHRAELALPHILHLGVTTLCNLRCPACPTGTKALGRPGGHLEFGVYERVIEEMRDTLMFMLFWDWGEPLMHPRIHDMLALASANSIRTVVSTSGTIANSENQIERLVSAQPSLIIVCVDGATQASYEKYRVGGRLDKVMTTLERLAAKRREMGLEYPIIEFRTLATRYNEGEMPDLLRMAETSGADFFSLKTLRPYDYRGRDVDDELAPLSSELARYAYEDGKHAATARIQNEGPLRCGKPLYAPTLNSDGILVFCSYAGHEEEYFGDVRERGLKKLWRSRSAREKRLSFLESEGGASCQTCYFRTDHKPTILTTIPLRALPRGVGLEREETRDAFLREHAG